MFQWKNYIPDIRLTLESFTEDAQKINCINGNTSGYNQAINEQKEKLLNIFDSFNTENEEACIEEYLDFCIHNDLPYFFIVNELANVIKDFLWLLASEEKCSSFTYAKSHFTLLENKISEAYYHQFLRKLAIKHHLRLSHLSTLVEKNLMIHYQHHLEWMLIMIAKLQGTALEETVLQLDHMKCSFGQWLHDPTIPYLSTTSYFKDVQKLHITLHELASDVMAQHNCGGGNFKNIVQLLQNLDYISLEIGNEIAIINDMLIIGEYTKDPLTGLLGRRQFEKIVTNQIEIAKATESECSLMMCDLDHFKEVNDCHGHPAGDEVIKNFASVLQNSLRKSDFIFRFGGEEFIVLLSSTSYKQAYTFAEHIRQISASQQVEYEGKYITYTVSIGVTGIDANDLSFVTKDTMKKYIQDVDAKLYLAKHNGRNRVE